MTFNFSANSARPVWRFRVTPLFNLYITIGALLIPSLGHAQELNFEASDTVYAYIKEGVEMFDVEVKPCPPDYEGSITLCGRVVDKEKFMSQWTQRAREVGSTAWGHEPLEDPWYFVDYIPSKYYAHTEYVYGEARNQMKIFVNPDGTLEISAVGSY